MAMAMNWSTVRLRRKVADRVVYIVDAAGEERKPNAMDGEVRRAGNLVVDSCIHTHHRAMAS